MCFICLCRQTLHSVVLHLVQAQGEVWSQLPIIANATSLRISELKTDPTQVSVALLANTCARESMRLERPVRLIGNSPSTASVCIPYGCYSFMLGERAYILIMCTQQYHS